MSNAVYPGSFDPVTLGHLDVIGRAAKVCDHLVIGILKNSDKKSPLFTPEERKALLCEVTKDFPNVSVEIFDGMTVDLAHRHNAHLIIRGLRAVTDFESEMQIAQTNHSIAPDIDTIFFTTDLKYSFLSSSIVKEVGFYGGDISGFVPPPVEKAIKEKVRAKK